MQDENLSTMQQIAQQLKELNAAQLKAIEFYAMRLRFKIEAVEEEKLPKI